MTRRFDALLSDAKRLGMLDKARLARLKDLLRARQDAEAIDLLRTLVAPVPGSLDTVPDSSRTENAVEAPAGSAAARDPLRPWTWPSLEFECWLAGRRWIQTCWAKAGGHELVLLVDPQAREEAHRAHPDLPVIDLTEATALADASEQGQLSSTGLVAVLDTKRVFNGVLDPRPRPLQPIFAEGELAELVRPIAAEADWATARYPTAGFPTGEQVRERFRGLAVRLGKDGALRLAEHCYTRLVAVEFELPAADSTAPACEFVRGFRAWWSDVHSLPKGFASWEDAALEADIWGAVDVSNEFGEPNRIPVPDGFTWKFPYCMSCHRRHPIENWPAGCEKPAAQQAELEQKPLAGPPEGAS